MFLPQLRDQVSQPYKKTGKIIVLYTLMFIFLERKEEDRRRGLNDGRQSLSLMRPKVLSERLRPSVLNPGTS